MERCRKKVNVNCLKHPQLLGKTMKFIENSRYRRQDSNGVPVVYTNTVSCDTKPAITSVNNPAALIILFVTDPVQDTGP